MVRSNEDANNQVQYKKAMQLGAGAAGLGLGALAYKDGKNFIKGRMNAKTSAKEANFLSALSEYANRDIARDISAEQHANILNMGGKTYRSSEPLTSKTKIKSMLKNGRGGDVRKAQKAYEHIGSNLNFLANKRGGTNARAIAKATKLFKL